MKDKKKRCHINTYKQFFAAGEKAVETSKADPERLCSD